MQTNTEEEATNLLTRVLTIELEVVEQAAEKQQCVVQYPNCYTSSMEGGTVGDDSQPDDILANDRK